MNKESAMKVSGVLGCAAMLACAGLCIGQPAGDKDKGGHPTAGANPHAAAQPAEDLDWKKLETGLLTRHNQVTSRDMFLRAGEQYFNADATWIIFQAVAVPPAGQAPDPFYSMYVAKILRDGEGHVKGLGAPIKVSPEASANTCGWFHPVEPWRLIMGSTLVRPKDDQKSGFRVGDRKYVWQFPDEMEIVSRSVMQIAEDLRPGDARNADVLKAADATKCMPVFNKPNYDAECSYSKDGRFILYAHVRDEKTNGRADADIWIYDTVTKADRPVVVANGYDGGPFFSPDGKRICYRSDRKQDDLLQLYVSELVFDKDGIPTGTTNERQLTSGESVNWAPYWHPSGKFLVYGTSEVSHANYEIFVVDASSDKPAGELGKRRVSFATGADVLPVFSNDGKLMMWCSQRGPKVAGEEKSSSQVWIAECVPGGFDRPETLFKAAPTTKPASN